MSASVRWSGLDELRTALRNLPADLASEAGPIVNRAGQDAAQNIRAEYQAHRVTNNLAEHVKVDIESAGQFGALSRVRSTAKHAWMFENGTQARHYVTTGGKEHRTGKMWGKTPPAHTFVRNAMRSRRKMYEQLKALLVRFGATVTGDV